MKQIALAKELVKKDEANKWALTSTSAQLDTRPRRLVSSKRSPMLGPDSGTATGTSLAYRSKPRPGQKTGATFQLYGVDEYNDDSLNEESEALITTPSPGLIKAGAHRPAPPLISAGAHPPVPLLAFEEASTWSRPTTFFDSLKFGMRLLGPTFWCSLCIVAVALFARECRHHGDNSSSQFPAINDMASQFETVGEAVGAFLGYCIGQVAQWIVCGFCQMGSSRRAV
jgi:hypothetical protein